jgi:hypothetical protein
LERIFFGDKGEDGRVMFKYVFKKDVNVEWIDLD